jgi:hypothetical protein
MSVRRVALFLFVAVVVVSLALFLATGQRLFTQLPSDSLAKLEQTKPADDPFAGLGMNDVSCEPVKVDNAFHFGLLPSGSGHAFADSASVLTICTPAFIAFLFVVWYTRRTPRTHAA